ncbi:MarR family transcriptional regulator [Aurantiacibacter xanthus]|uniref:MarR family transcriptional regulator n=1 Tax=Aurantiacibacter xanthus TaxID=1784712 RepID=A0A3A1NZN4_9SPHN|nr:MarR family transcriptional regulator [Aurantiacibacter xanthus]RIV81367.1 MarR family transcriptional regulator [Aurantiacibacter xanthus]
MAGEQNGDHALLAGIQNDLLSPRILVLRRLLEQSARTDFAGLEPDNSFTRRILFALYRNGEGRVFELAYTLGSDMAQVSRGLTALRKDGLVNTRRQRDPYTLTPEGEKLGKQLFAIAEQREARLLHGLETGEIIELVAMLIHLQARASTLLAEELALARAEGEPAELPTAHTEFATRVHPLLYNLANTVLRTATAAFKRLAGVSQFEWRVLVNMADRPAIPFAGLVQHIGVDKGQLSRTLNALEQSGLIVRSFDGAGTSRRLDLTTKGRRVYRLMEADSEQRNARMIDGLRPIHLDRLRAQLDRLIANIVAAIPPA